MGGDIALAIPILDRRVQVITAAIATPDWLRPGTSQKVGHPSEDALAFFERFNPMNHLDAYDHRPAIFINAGENDTMVPPQSAATFIRVLRALYGEDHARLDLHIHPGVAHQFNETMWAAHLDWFRMHLGGDTPETRKVP